MTAPASRRPSGAKRAAVWFLALVLLLGAGYFAYTHRQDIERYLRGISDNEAAKAATQAAALHAQGLTGEGVILCVVDTGANLTHPGLQGINVVAWSDLVNERPDPYDDQGHGTAMVGLIAARGLVGGFAPDVSLVVVKAVDERGQGDGETVAEGISFCMDPFGDGRSAHIVSLSLGGSPRPRQEDVLVTRVQEAANRGVLVVAAVGNEGNRADDVQSPASQEATVAVGAVDDDLRIASFSQPGDHAGREDPHRKPEVVAPGVDLTTTGAGGIYVRISGTSAATALVSALLALVFQGEPALQALSGWQDVLTVKTAIMTTARALDGQETPHDDLYGYGLLQAAALLEALEGGV